MPFEFCLRPHRSQKSLTPADTTTSMNGNDNTSPCGVCEDVIASDSSKKRSVLGCGHKLCNRCLASRVRIIKADKIMVVKCPVNGCSAITVKPLPQKYCGDSPRERHIDGTNRDRKLNETGLLPTQPGTENEHDLTEAFGSTDGNSDTFAVGFAKRINFAAILSLIMGLMQHMVAMTYATVIVALAGGFIWGFEYGFAHNMVESLNHGSAKWFYPSLLAGLFVLEWASTVRGRSLAALVCLDALALATLGSAVLGGADFSYCHSIDRYLAMSVSSYWVPMVLAATVTVEVASGMISLTTLIGRHIHGQWRRLFSSKVSSESSGEHGASEDQQPQPPRSPLAGPGSPPLSYYPRRHAQRQAAILLDSDLTVRCSGYAEVLSTPVKPALSSSRAGTGNATCGSSGGARRRVSFTPALDEAELRDGGAESTAVPSGGKGYIAGGAGEPSDGSSPAVSSGAESSSICDTDRQVRALSPSRPESPAHTDILSRTSHQTECDSSDSDSDGEGKREGDEQNTTSELWRLDTTPRILRGTAPAGYVHRARSPLWPTAPAHTATPTAEEGRGVNSDGSGAAEGTADRTTSVIQYRPEPSPLTSRQLEPDCATPTQQYQAASSDKASNNAGQPAAEEVSATDDTALLLDTFPPSLPATPRQPPGPGQLCTPDGHLPCVDSPEDDFKLHSNIKLKPLGTFSTIGPGMGGRRQVQVCELSEDAATPVEGYTNAYLIAASEHNTPSSPPTLRSALATYTGSEREPTSNAATPALPRVASKANREQKDAGGRGEGKRPLFKSVFLGVTGRGGVIR